jgi:hypothetical protein
VDHRESGTAFDPDDIADHYWRLYVQPPGWWERELVLRGAEPVLSRC